VKPFRFRAEIVLALRRREEEDAKTALAGHRALAERAWALVQTAREALAAAGQAMERDAAAGATHQTLLWHRSWITRLRRDVQLGQEAATEADYAAAVAATALSRAMQRRRVLERLRDRAWRVYGLARDRAELQEMNQLATVRFAHQALNPGASRDD
jgi:flagellar export protein FliJ